MSDFNDHIEDFDEEGDEFRRAIEDALEEDTGIEWTATDIYDREEVGQIDVHVEPTNTGEALKSAFDNDVSINGNLTVQFQK